MNNNQILNLRDIAAVVKPLAVKYNVKEVYLFGSYARNQANENSDIDVLIYGDEAFKPVHVFVFAEELRERLGKDVDVFEIREVNQDSDFYKTIMQEKVLVA